MVKMKVNIDFLRQAKTKYYLQTYVNLIKNALSNLRIDQKIETRKESFKNLHAVTYEDVKKVLRTLFIDSKNAVYEAKVPNEYDKSISQNHLKKYLL